MDAVLAALAALLRVLHNIVVAVDYGASMLLWLHVEEPMTISSRCGLALRWPRQPGQAVLRQIGSLLNWIDYPARQRGSTHCEEAILADRGRAQAADRRLSP
jgi:hypothetical protein